MSAKYMELASRLRSAIEKNTGDVFQLPTEAALCKQYDLSRQTVRKALSTLEDEGLIERRQGSGTYTTGLSGSTEKNQVAILISSDTEYLCPGLLADMRETLQKSGFSCAVYVTDNHASREREILQELLLRPVRGILSEGCKTAFPSLNHDLYRALAQKKASVLFFHGSYPNLHDFPSVKDDNYEGGYYLGRHLASLGHRKITGIFRNDDERGVERCFGLLSALRDEHLPLCEDCFCYFDAAKLISLQKKQDTGFLSDFIAKQLSGCSAVVCHDDEIAYWLMKELTYREIKVPEDVSVVGFDNSYLGDLSPVRLTSLSHKSHEMGTAASETLLKLMKGIPAPSLKLPWHLANRASCGPAPR